MYNSTSNPEESVTRDSSSPQLPSQFQNSLPDHTKANLLNQITGLELTLEEKEKTIENLHNNIENLEKTIQLLAEAEKTHANRNTLLEAELAKISSENRLLKQQEEVLKRVIQEEKQDIDVLRDNRKEYLEEYEKINQEKMTLENENVQRWDRIVKLEDEVKDHEKTINRLKNEKTVLESQLKNCRNGIGEHYHIKTFEELRNKNSALKVWLGIAIAVILFLLVVK